VRVGYLGEWSRYFSVGASYQTKIWMIKSIELKMDQWDFELGWSFGIRK